MRVKVTLNKSFCTKTKYIQNNNGLPILTLDLWKKKKKKQKKSIRNMKRINFVPQDIQRILSSHKILEKDNEHVFCIKRCT